MDSSQIDATIARVVQTVAELPDRTSPDDWPEALLVTSEELSQILREALPTLPASPAATSGLYDALMRQLRNAIAEDTVPAFELKRVIEQAIEAIPRLRVSAAERPAQTWQPIESAPKDGSSVLVWWPRMNPENPCIARATELDSTAPNGPTHWMPLPAPPGPVAQEKDK